jgi:hypothetical protein
MRRQPIHSSMIASAGYDKKKSVLEIEFNSGAIWHYYDVTEKIFEGLKKSSSAGRYFDDYIKDEYEEMRIR